MRIALVRLAFTFLVSTPADQGTDLASRQTCMFDGKQHIAVASGSNIIAFGLPD